MHNLALALVRARPPRYGLCLTSDRLLCAAALLLLASSPLHAKSARPPARPEATREPIQNDQPGLLQDKLPETPKYVLACSGIFGRDTSHAKLAAEFGARNVVFKEVDGQEGTKDKATVLFDDDPTRRAVVYWRDLKARASPTRIDVNAPSTWSGPGGIRNGLPLKEVEKL